MASHSSSTRWKVVLGAILVQLILGTVYGYSIFWRPLSAEIFPPVVTEIEAAALVTTGESVEGFTIVADEQAVDRQIATQQGYLKYAFSICILSFALIMIFAGRLQDLKGPRLPALLGGLLMGGGFMLAGLMNTPIIFYLAHAAFAGGVAIVLLMLSDVLLRDVDRDENPFAKYLPFGIVTSVIVAAIVLANEYVGRLGEWDAVFLLWGTVGFLAGAGIGLAYVCPIAALVKWFPRHKGLVSGVAVAGFGLGAFFFKGDPYIVSTAWLTIPIPGAQGFSETYGIRNLFFVHGLVCLIGIGLGALLLTNPPGLPTPSNQEGESAWQETLRRPAFYLLWAMFFSGAMAGLMVIGIVQPFVTQTLASGGLGLAQAAAAGTAAVGYLAIFNALGRVLWGLVSDRLGRTPTFVILFLAQATVMFLLGHLNGVVALTAGAALVGFNFGGNFALFPSATSDLFGAKNFGANYGWMFTAFGIAGVVGIVAGNAAQAITGSYSAAFTVAGTLCLLSAGLAVALNRIQRPADPAQPRPLHAQPLSSKSS